MFARIRRSWLSRMAVVLFALGLMTSFSGVGRADIKTQDTEFKLTGGDFREFTFVPSAAGAINVNVSWKNATLGLGKEPALLVELFRPGESTPIAKTTAGTPVILKD